MTGVFTHSFDNESFKGQVTINTGLFIDGKWVEGFGGNTIEYVTPTSHAGFYLTKSHPSLSVLNPTTGKLLAKVSEGTAKDVDLAVAAAQRAFDTTWGLNTPGDQRAVLLNKLADIMQANFDELCAVEALDNGAVF